MPPSRRKNLKKHVKPLGGFSYDRVGGSKVKSSKIEGNPQADDRITSVEELMVKDDDSKKSSCWCVLFFNRNKLDKEKSKAVELHPQ